MGHGNLSPRQKMINMMYLVLTALLAMNVSAEVLNAFVLVNESLRKTESNVSAKNDVAYIKFDEQYKLNPNKVESWKKLAEDVKSSSKELTDYITTLQKMIIVEGGDKYEDFEKHGTAIIKSKKDMDTPTRIMLEDESEGKARGLILKEKINAYRNKLISVLDSKNLASDEAKASLAQNLNTDKINGHEGEVEWEIANFSQLPLVASLTMLSKMKTDILNAESDVISKLLLQIDADSYKFNKLEAFVAPESDYVLQGEKYKARIFIAASDTTQEPAVYMKGGGKLKIEEGKGIYVGGTGAPGIKTFSGVIKVMNPATKDTDDYKFEHKYQVAVPNFSVSPTKMNVFYKGVDNPVEISASGVDANAVQASISNGTISKIGNGKYIVRVKRLIDTYIGVSANGKSLGARKKFRVKILPDPTAFCNGIKNGPIGKGALRAQNGIYAKLENSLFEMRFRVLTFKLSAMIGGFEKSERSNGNRFSPAQKSLIAKVRKGTRIIIEGIKAKGPDGIVRELNTVVLKIK